MRSLVSRKLFGLCSLLLISQVALAQVASDVIRVTSSTLPVSCKLGEIRNDSGASNALKYCNPNNTWSLLGGNTLPNFTSGRVLLGDGTNTPVTDAGLTYDSTTDVLTATGFVGALTGNASTATALAANPTDCAASNFANAIAANGNLTCAQAAFTDISGTLAINKGGTGQITAQAAIDALVPSQTSNSTKFLTTNGTTVAWDYVSGSGFFNLLSGVNWNFEKATATDDWTASGGTFAAATSTNILDGLKSVTWDSGSASQTLSSTAVTIPYGMYGRNGWAQCKYLTPSGSATHKIQVYDGTNVISEQTITSSTVPTFSGTSFIYPSTGTLLVRTISVASDEPLVAIDSCGIYDANEVKLTNISQAQFIGSAYFATTTNCQWSRTSTTVGAFTTDIDCPGPTVDINPGPGVIQTTDVNLPRWTVNNLPSGYIRVVFTGVIGTDTSSTNQVYAISDGTTTSPLVSGGLGINSGGGTTTVEAIFYYANPGDRSFEIYCANTSGSCALNNQATNAKASIRIYRYPLASEQTQTYDTAKWQIDANISGANISLGTSAQSAYVTPNNSGLTLVQNAISAPVGISCSSTNDNTVGATTCSAGSEEPGIVTNLPRAGIVEVCFAFSHYANFSPSGGIDATFQVVTTANGSQTIDLQGNSRIQSGSSLGAEAFAHPNHICGTFNFPSPGKKTVRLMYEQTVGGTISSNQLQADAGASNGQRDIHVYARYVDQSPNAMTVKNSVVTTSNGVTSLEAAKVNCDSGSAILSQQGSWVSSVGNISSGSCVLTLSAGTFSGAPYCTGNASGNTGSGLTNGLILNIDATSSTSVTVDCTTDTTAACTAFDFFITCVGPK